MDPLMLLLIGSGVIIAACCGKVEKDRSAQRQQREREQQALETTYNEQHFEDRMKERFGENWRETKSSTTYHSP